MWLPAARTICTVVKCSQWKSVTIVEAHEFIASPQWANEGKNYRAAAAHTHAAHLFTDCNFILDFSFVISRNIWWCREHFPVSGVWAHRLLLPTIRTPAIFIIFTRFRFQQHGVMDIFSHVQSVSSKFRIECDWCCSSSDTMDVNEFISVSLIKFMAGKRPKCIRFEPCRSDQQTTAFGMNSFVTHSNTLTRYKTCIACNFSLV